MAELSRVGFAFSDQPSLVDGVITEERQGIYDSTSEGWPRVAGYTKGQKHLFYFDGFDSDRKIGFKFVSSANYLKLGGPDSNSTVSSYDMVAVAQETRELLGTEKVSAVVFYDPTILRSGCKPPECREDSKELLKEQVRDFVAWYARAFPRE